ncbi:MAG: hypothetical protein RMX63_03920 [Aulosira sp. ZfuCHP01]|nr:hypothetical protein [Aulosira sp. ZfuVER01]MDZ7996969.1 hypothetical protein [Aulosira sp. DedVER01a]MDZ8050589.1 hypothetical protein [Aulosira sp. ZfuCHP01]
MKTLLRTLSFALVVALAVIVANIPAVTGTMEIAQAQKAVNNKPIDLALPTIAQVLLKNGSSLTGGVTAFDSKGQKIQFSHSGDSRSFPVAQVKQITFSKDKDALVYTSTGEVVIRGENNAQAKQSTWSGIPLQGFKLVNPKFGQASVNLATVKTPKELRQIQSVAVKSLYVADEIEFTPAGKMTIKVTPIDR